VQLFAIGTNRYVTVSIVNPELERVWLILVTPGPALLENPVKLEELGNARHVKVVLATLESRDNPVDCPSHCRLMQKEISSLPLPFYPGWEPIHK